MSFESEKMLRDPNKKQFCVLVVEDEALILFAVSDELRDHGFKVLEASNSAEALTLIEVHQDIDLLFTDINMPGKIDGLQLAAIARELRPELKIIVTSGKNLSNSNALPDGGLFMPKPYMPDKVSSAIDSLLS